MQGDDHMLQKAYQEERQLQHMEESQIQRQLKMDKE
jgi:hypothetical protein